MNEKTNQNRIADLIEAAEVGSKKNKVLERLYKQGVVGRRYSSPEENTHMIETADNYEKGRRSRDALAFTRFLAARTLEDLKPRPEGVFRRAMVFTMRERLTALSEELFKMSFSKYHVSRPKLSDRHLDALLSDRPEDSEERLEAINLITKWEKTKIPFSQDFKIRSMRLNRTRVGKLKWYEKLIGYSTIFIQSWRRK